jgi:hypothetical protein
LQLYGGMSEEKAGAEVGASFADADAVRAGRGSRARFGERRDKSTRAVIVSSLFLAFIAAALLIGGHAVLDPQLPSSVATRQGKLLGDVFYTMPDGVYCRHMSFDNATAEVVEGAIEPCASDGARERSGSINGFTWDTR